MRLALSKRGITVAVDNVYSGPYRIDGRTEQVADVPWHHYNDFWNGTPPIRLHGPRGLRGVEEDARQPASHDGGEAGLSVPRRVQSAATRHEAAGPGDHVRVQLRPKILEELFPGEMIEFGRRFVSDPNAGAIAIGSGSSLPAPSHRSLPERAPSLNTHTRRSQWAPGALDRDGDGRQAGARGHRRPSQPRSRSGDRSVS